MTTRPTPEGTPPVNPERPEDDDASEVGEARLVDDETAPADRPVGSSAQALAEDPLPDPAQDGPVGTAPEAPRAPTEEVPEAGPADAAVIDAEPSEATDAASATAPHPLEGWTATDVPWDVAADLADEPPYVPIQAAPDPVAPLPAAQGAPTGAGPEEPAAGAPAAGAPAERTSNRFAPAAPGPAPDRPDGRTGAAEDASSSPTTPPLPPSAPPVAPTGARASGWSKLGRSMRPTVNRSQLLAGLLCALLGFALAVQVSQTQEEQLSSLRQSDLVRLLDDVTQRANELEARVSSLQETRDELSSGSGQQRAALELAQRQAESQGILSGRLPAEGPGIELTITEGDRSIPANKLFNILEELRNAGVEVVEVNGVRLVTSSYFEETSRGMVVDGQVISSPYRWKAIGDPSTLETALEIPGGAMATVRNEGAEPEITQQDLVTITSTRVPQAPQFATPVPAEGGD